MKSKNKSEQNQMNLMELKPIHIHSFEYRPDGQIDVLVPRFKNAFLQSFLYSSKLMPKNRCPYIKANLDEIGSAAWELFNGKHTVKEIAKLLEEKFQASDRYCIQSDRHSALDAESPDIDDTVLRSPAEIAGQARNDGETERNNSKEKTENNYEKLTERLAMFVQKMNANKFITFIEFMEN